MIPNSITAHLQRYIAYAHEDSAVRYYVALTAETAEISVVTTEMPNNIRGYRGYHATHFRGNCIYVCGYRGNRMYFRGNRGILGYIRALERRIAPNCMGSIVLLFRIPSETSFSW